MALKKFLEFEHENQLDELVIQNLHIWDFIRMQIYFSNFQSNSRSTQSLTQSKIKLAARLLKLSINKLFHSRKYQLKTKCEILFLGHPRRIKTNGVYKDIYCDYFIEEMNSIRELKNLELSIDFEHFHPAATKNVFFLDMVELKMALAPFLNNYILSKSDIQKIRLLNIAFKKKFNKEINLIPLIQTRVNQILSVQKTIKEIIISSSPKIIIAADGYNLIKKIFFYESNKLNIPSAELQHGAIGKSHVGYNYPENFNVTSFPHRLLVWGEYWLKNLSLPVASTALPIGFPHLESQFQKIPINKNKYSILVISQWTIGENLMQNLNTLAQNNPDFTFYFKLHPSEFHAKKKYEELRTERNILIIGQERNIYSFFGECHSQIGVYSTALFEGFLFGLQTFILPLENHVQVKDFIGSGFQLIAQNHIFKPLNKTTIKQEKGISEMKLILTKAKENFNHFIKQEID